MHLLKQRDLQIHSRYLIALNHTFPMSPLSTHDKQKHKSIHQQNITTQLHKLSISSLNSNTNPNLLTLFNFI